MIHRALGTHGPTLFPLGLGCMGMSDLYGPADEAVSVRTIHAALDAGVQLLDTGDFYGSGHNEMLIGRALAGRRHHAVLSVKFGSLRTPDGGWAGVDARPAAVKNFAVQSLRRLGTDYIDIYRPARLDPAVPIEDTVGAIADLVRGGYVRYIGLSEVGPDTIRRAAAVHPIADLQVEYSLLSRGPERQTLPLLDDLGIGLTAYGVLSRGLVTGARPGQRDYRAWLPRFSAENRAHNDALVAELAHVARDLGCTPAQVAIAWVLSRGPHVLPVLGARTPERLAECLGALALRLDASALARVEAALPHAQVAGTRYDAAHMSVLDSERV